MSAGSGRMILLLVDPRAVAAFFHERGRFRLVTGCLFVRQVYLFISHAFSIVQATPPPASLIILLALF